MHIMPYFQCSRGAAPLFVGVVIIVILCVGAHAETREWTTVSGKTFEAEYSRILFDNVCFKPMNGKEIRIPLEQLSANDLSYIELMNPPKLDIEFIHRSDHLLGYLKGSPFLSRTPPPTMTEYHFGVHIRKVGRVPYNHPLNVEYYAIGCQRQDRDKFIMLEKKSAQFTLSEENNFSFELLGQKMKMMFYDRNGPMGRAYSGYIIIVTDSRGQIVEHAESKNWLFSNLENLRKLPVGSFMDNTCSRVYPTGAVSYWY